jgi:hypothetical protein
MGMHGLGQLTAKQQRRLFFIKEIGCIACIMYFGQAGEGGEGHHTHIPGRKKSHDDMVCLCPWHHQGKPPSGYTEKRALEVFGPARKTRPAFEAVFGTDEKLLEYQNARLAAFCASFVTSPL